MIQKLQKINKSNLDYDNFSKTFSKSRENMQWEEISYLIKFLNLKNKNKDFSILDVGSGNGRLLAEFSKLIPINGDKKNNYLGIDSSKKMLEEAKKKYSNHNFIYLDMLNLDKLEKNRFDYIFFIASFHHLKNMEDRISVLNNSFNLLKDIKSRIFMVNWSLNSDFNYKRYKNSIIKGSENSLGGVDYNIKIGNFLRFYHSFSIEELDYIFKKTGFQIIENKLFKGEKNIVSIIKKNQ